MKKRASKSLFREYISHWYVILVSMLLIFPAYMLLPLVLSFCMASGISAFWAGIISIAASGFLATFPMLIFNIRLAFRAKPYALAVQFVLFDVLGTVFYVTNRILMN